MLNSKIKLALALLSWNTLAYSATQHLFQVDIDLNTNDSATVAFQYDTTSEQGPGAVVYTRRDDGASTHLFGMDVYGESIKLTKAVVQYDIKPYEKYKLNANCQNIKFNQGKDDRGILLTLHLNRDSKSIDCTNTLVH